MLGALNVRTQALLLTALIVLILAVVVWTRRERARTTLPFSLVNLFVVIFSASYVGMKLTGDHLFLRAFASSAVFLMPAYLYLTSTYLHRPNRWLEAGLVVLFGASAVFSVTAFIPQIDSAMHLASLFPPGLRNGRVALAILALAAPSLTLVALRLRAEPVVLMRRRYAGLLVVSAATAVICAVDEATGGGPLGPFVLMMYHYYLFQSLVRYQSFNLGHTVGRLILLAASGLFLFLVYGLFFYFVRPAPILFVFHTFIVAFMLMVVYEPLFGGLASRAREWVQRGRGDVGRRIDALLAELSQAFSLEDVGEFLARRVPAELGFTGAAVYVAKDAQTLERLASGLPGPPDISGELVEDLLREAQRPISSERLVQLASESYPGPERERFLRLVELLGACQARWLILMRQRGELVGLYVIAAGILPEYGQETGALPAVIADQAAVRIVNARIYQRLRAQDRMATLGQLAASLAHEIRNPLGSMKGAAQYLADENLDGPMREFVDIIVSEADRLNGVLTRFLDYARPFALNRKDLDVRDVVRATIEFLRDGEMPDDVEVLTHVPGAPVVWSVDPDQLRQVLINLVKNAWQAQPAGGLIEVTVDVRDERLRIEVSDHAAPINPADREKLFMPFFTTKKTGSGLGLPISQRIVQAHGGAIRVSTNPDGGNRFLIEIPELAAAAGEGGIETAGAHR